MSQAEFGFSAQNPSRLKARTPVPKPESHGGECSLDFDSPPHDKIVPSMLRCSLDKTHRVRLEPSSRAGVMRELLARGCLVGGAAREAQEWMDGTARLFHTKGCT